MKRILFFLVLFLPCVLFAQQGINNNWLMGYYSYMGIPFGQTRMDFFNGSPTVSFDSIEMDFNHTHANISDGLGNMLFYTNGYYIADATNDTMLNGSGLNPGAFADDFSDGFSIPQGAVIIKRPGSNSIYYLFHSSVDNYPQSNASVAYQLYKTEIDMSLNNGHGAVISKNIPVITDTLNVGKIAMCKHANGRDWWLIVHKAYSNKFYKLLIISNVILGPYTQSIGVVRQWDAGQAGFSPDGKRYAYFYIYGGLDILDFNRCSGTLSNPIHIGIPNEGGGNVGVAFSPNSNVLYVSNVFHIYQYDLNASNIPGSVVNVAAYDSFLSVAPGQPGIPTLFAYPALAPDGKIYITTGNSTLHLHSIDNPDVIGTACNVNQHSVQLPAYYYNTMPNHPNYFLNCDTTLGCLCAVTTNTNEVSSKENGLKVFPNPTNGKFTLQFNVQSTAGSAEIYDVNGKLILQQSISPWSQYKQLNITNAASGIYYCKLKWGNEEVSTKVIKE